MMGEPSKIPVKERVSMIGTLTNVTTILVGSFLGSRLKAGLGERYRDILMNAMGMAALCLGLNSVVQAMPQSRYHVLFIVSLAMGGVVGTRLDLAAGFNRLVDRFSGGSDLAKGLSTAILLCCMGSMSILGPVQSALYGDNTYLFTNAILDGITSVVLSSTFGLGMALVAVVVFCWQGSIYLLATLIEPYLTDALLAELSLVGGVLIACSGLGILKIKEIPTLNLLPALAVPAIAVPLLQALGM